MRLKIRLLTSLFIRTPNNFRYYSRTTNLCNEHDQNLENWREQLHNTMQIIPNFISIDEQQRLMEEIEPHIKRVPYEKAHWDDVSML